jgi:peptidoglycan/xylan/chitin deacetylase (PgdA/CDA1 family)
MGQLIVSVPDTYLQERIYILGVLMKDFLAIDFEVVPHANREVIIQCQGLNDKKLILEDTLFQIPSEEWLGIESLPKLPLLKWNINDDLPEALVCNPEMPVLYGRYISHDRYFIQQENFIHIGLDILGSCFFMLSRYEEAVLKQRDQHGRFQAIMSVAYKESIIERPIVNEYLEILWATMKRLWPNLQKKSRRFKIFLTHDVDIPFAVTGLSLSKIAKSCLGDLIKRKSLGLGIKRWQSLLNTRKYGADYDLYNTFDYLMDKSEEKGLKSTFYFMTNFSNKKYDGNYSLENPWICELLRKIHRRGHEIGLHPSYDSYNDIEKTIGEFQYLKKICEQENIFQDNWGGRQHYLRWDIPITWRNLDEAGLEYDSTLGYAEKPDFRCGTCFEFPVFDLQYRNQLKLRERPLTVMEGSLFGVNYMALKHDRAFDEVNRMISICRLFHGDFVLLWHNNNLLTNQDRKMYENILNLYVY